MSSVTTWFEHTSCMITYHLTIIICNSLITSHILIDDARQCSAAQHHYKDVFTQPCWTHVADFGILNISFIFRNNLTSVQPGEYNEVAPLIRLALYWPSFVACFLYQCSSCTVSIKGASEHFSMIIFFVIKC